MTTAQQKTDAARAAAAGQALLARIRRENAAHDRLIDHNNSRTTRQIAEEQKEKAK